MLLPEVIYDYFELVDTVVSDKDVHLFLDERHIPPKTAGYESKGFTEQSIIQDFPLRGKPVYLHIRRRKWLEKDTGKVNYKQLRPDTSGDSNYRRVRSFLKRYL